MYPNVDFVSRATCPVFVIHGKADEEVTIEHGRGIMDVSAACLLACGLSLLSCVSLP